MISLKSILPLRSFCFFGLAYLSFFLNDANAFDKISKDEKRLKKQAEALFAEHNYKKAAAVYKILGKISPENGDYLIQLGAAYLHLADHERAIETLKKTISINISGRKNWFYLAQAYHGNQNHSYAITYYKKYLAAGVILPDEKITIKQLINECEGALSKNKVQLAVAQMYKNREPVKTQNTEVTVVESHYISPLHEISVHAPSAEVFIAPPQNSTAATPDQVRRKERIQKKIREKEELNEQIKPLVVSLNKQRKIGGSIVLISMGVNIPKVFVKSARKLNYSKNEFDIFLQREVQVKHEKTWFVNAGMRDFIKVNSVYYVIKGPNYLHYPKGPWGINYPIRGPTA